MKNESFNKNLSINLRMNMNPQFQNVHLDFRICENSSKDCAEGVGNGVAQEAKSNRGHTGKMFQW